MNKEKKPIELHHIEIEIVDCNKREVKFDFEFFTSETSSFKICTTGYIIKKKGDKIRIDAYTSKIE